LFGIWVDFTRHTKSAILLANLFEMGGNINNNLLYAY
jgi:hypothetical protein